MESINGKSGAGLASAGWPTSPQFLNATMLLSSFTVLFFATLASAGAYPPDVVDILQQKSIPKLKEWLRKHPQGNCTYETAARRKEW
jgi:hypothetical protein